MFISHESTKARNRTDVFRVFVFSRHVRGLLFLVLSLIISAIDAHAQIVRPRADVATVVEQEKVRAGDTARVALQVRRVVWRFDSVEVPFGRQV